jgi:hypothetical protein
MDYEINMFNVEGLFLLTINGMDGIAIFWSLRDLTCILTDIHDRLDGTLHNALTGFTFLFGKFDHADDQKYTLSSEQHYHAVSCSIFSLSLEGLADKHNNLDTSDISNELA